MGRARRGAKGSTSLVGGKGGSTSTSPSELGGIPASIWLGTFLVALAGVCLEVSLVRVFALVFRYHHLFLLVSVAVCGLGLGGLVRTYLPERFSHLWLSALLFGLSIPAVLLILFRSPLAAHLVDTPWLSLLPLAPFLFAGLFLSEVFRRYASLGGALYFADLSGAALAALLVIPLLQGLGGIGTCFLLAALLCVGAALLVGGAAGASQTGLAGPTGPTLAAPDDGAPAGALGPARAARLLAALACFALLVLNQRLHLVDLPPLPPDADPTITKPLLKDLQPGSNVRIAATRWSAFARTDMTDEGDPTIRYIYTDGDTPTHMIRFDGDLKKVSGVAQQMGYLGMLPYRVGRPQSVLCIGPGGGMDVLLAMLGGAKRIVGAEINAETVGLMDEFREFNGDLYHRPGVQVHVADGRSFTAQSREKFDLIYSALTQSATGARAGIALAESYIHTREAFDVYLNHLTANGTYALIVQEEPVLARAFVTAVSVLNARGESVPEACRHLIAASIPEEMRQFTPYRRILLLRRSPFTREEAERAVKQISSAGLHTLFAPYVLESIPPFAPLAQGQETVEQFVAGYRTGDYPINISPRPDDQPFFLDLSIAMPGALRQLLWGVGVAVIAAGLLLGFRRRRGGAGAVARGVLGAYYFAILGAGFMLLEIPLIQQFILFLGHPVRSLALVLFALLVGTAIGSRWSQRWPVAALPARVMAAAGAAAVLALLYRAVLPSVFAGLLGLDLAMRSAVSVFLLLPLGLVLGMPFPSGIRWMEREGNAQVPWLWGMNGLASVLGSVLAMALAWKVGFSAALLAGTGAYVLAALLALAARCAGPQKHPV